MMISSQYVITEIKRLCAETDVETAEPTQGWLVGNLEALVAKLERAESAFERDRWEAERAARRREGPSFTSRLESRKDKMGNPTA